jgi:hypothetical protein
MKRQFLLVISCLVMCLSLGAQEMNEEFLSEIELPDVSSRGSSAANREDLDFSVGFGYGMTYTVPAASVNAEIFLDAKQTIIIGMVGVKDRERINDPLLDDTLKAISLGYKRFVGNSFYFAANIYYRKHDIALKLDGEDDLFAENSVSTYSFEDLGGGFRIGNQWQWSNFTLGVDWLGVNRSIFLIEEKLKNYSEGLKIADVKRPSTSITAAYLYMGFSF